MPLEELQVKVVSEKDHYRVYVNDIPKVAFDAGESCDEAVADSVCHYLTGSWLY